jgi:hypothetical protein
MNSRLPPWLAACLCAVASLGHAADWKPIQGTYAITAQSVVDPGEAEPKDSHIRFQLTGRAARDLYAAMKTAPKADECTGALMKQVGEMKCWQLKAPARYECAFSIDVMKQQVDYGVPC